MSIKCFADIQKEKVEIRDIGERQKRKKEVLVWEEGLNIMGLDSFLGKEIINGLVLE